MSFIITGEASSGVVVHEAERVESEFVRLRGLEDTLPGMIRRNGELLAALVVAQGESGNVESAHRIRLEALRAEIARLNGAIDDQRAKAARLEPKVNQLQQSVDFMNSPAGQASAWSEKCRVNRERLARMGF